AQSMGRLLQAFEQSVPGPSLYVGVDQSLLGPLGELGYDATVMGTEFSVDLARFSLRGKAMKQLRHARNLDRRCRIEVREQCGDEVHWHKVAGISARRSRSGSWACSPGHRYLQTNGACASSMPMWMTSWQDTCSSTPGTASMNGRAIAPIFCGRRRK